MKKTIWVLGILLISACGTNQTNVDELDFANIVTGTVQGMETWGTAWGPGAFESNGERIFFTTINQDDKFLAYKGGPESDMMMGGVLTCASCHGPDGKGGSHSMYNYTMDAPDIRYAALQAEKNDNTEYNFEDFKSAVTHGKRTDGSNLDRYMPRWEVEEEDLADVLEFLKSLN
jgi:hypothetical protein